MSSRVAWKVSFELEGEDEIFQTGALLEELVAVRALGLHPQPLPRPREAALGPLHSVSIMDNFAQQRTGISHFAVNTDHSEPSQSPSKRIKGLIFHSIIIGY